MTRTLVFHFGALGDFVLSWPALGLLQAGPPPGQLHLVGNPDWGRLILPSQALRDREDRRLAALFLMEPTPELEAWLAGFERAVVFHQRPDPTLLAHLRLAGIKEVWTVPTRPAPGQSLHVGELQVLHLRGRGLGGAAATPPCLIPPAQEGVPPILAPGSGGRAKRLDPGLAAQLAAQMHELWGAPLLLLGPAEDAPYRAQLARALAQTPHQPWIEPALEELARRLPATPAFVGADSGVSHLAAALGAPTLALFQASDARLWAPHGPRARVCQAGQALERLPLLPRA